MSALEKQQPNLRLKRERERRGWSQEKLADLIGTTQKIVSRWERGGSVPLPYYREKLCTLFGKDAAELGLLGESPEDEGSSALTKRAAPDQTWPDPLLTSYLQRQRTRMFNTLAPGSTNLWVSDIVGKNGLFLPPPWERVQGSTPSATLVEYVIGALLVREKILLLGEAGQGKTTILKQVFSLLADRFLDEPDHSLPLPIYIPLRELSSLTGSAVETLWTSIGEDFPLPFEAFAALVRQHRIVFLFDGFDEISGELTQRAINERAASKVFTFPSLLSCRKSFFEFYLSMSALQEHYPQWIELQPLALTPALTHYIERFYQRKQTYGLQQTGTPPEKVIAFLRGRHELQDLVQRPLLLLMLLDIFTTPREMDDAQWSKTKLYQRYTEKWLKNEAAKPGSLLKWHEKALILQEVAWATYTGKSFGASLDKPSQQLTFTQRDVLPLLRQMEAHFAALTQAQLLEDLCFHTLLIVSEGENYGFLHKSFQEYFVARHIFESLRRTGEPIEVTQAIEGLLQENLPFDVATFLKEMLNSGTLSQKEKVLIGNALIQVYQHNRHQDQRSATIRQQACHYLTTLGTEQAIQSLEEVLEQEPDKWVQRGIMVGLVIHCERADMLERYIQILRIDPEAAAINLLYHLVYYGDHLQEVGYDLQGIDKCDKTVGALFRHLGDDRCRNAWALDLFTLSTLLELQGISVLAAYSRQKPFLEGFLSMDHSRGRLLAEEQERLHTLLERETISHGNE